MDPETSRIVVSPGSSGTMLQVHHRDFPEIRAEAQTPTLAAEHLIHQLTRALDTALTNWRRESIDKAIAEVREFVAQVSADEA